MAITQLQPFNLDSTANYTFANITTTNANLGNAATANFFIGSGNNLSNIQGANITGAVSSATTAGTITTGAQPNITSTGTLASLSVSGTSNLGNVGNVKITGGASGQAIITDGTGNLSFANAASGSDPAPMPTYIPVGDVITVAANYQGLFGYPITIDGTMTIDGVLIDVNDNRSEGGGTPGGSTTQLQYNNAGSFGGISTATYSGGQLSLGSNAQVKITGGSAGQVLSTDGAGNLSWANGGGSTGFLSITSRSGVIEVNIIGGYLNIVGRSGTIPIPIS